MALDEKVTVSDSLHVISPWDRAIYLQNFIPFVDLYPVVVYSGAHETCGLKCQTWAITV